MSPVGRTALQGLLVAAAVGLVLWLRTTWTAGTTEDLAHHVALTSLLAGRWQDSAPLVAALQELAHYPVGAHGLAALLAQVLEPPLLATNALAWLALLLCYAALLRLMAALSWGALLLSAAGVLAVFGLQGRAGVLLGGEIVFNYHFAQLVGEALYCAALLLLARRGRPDRPATALAALVGCGLLLLFHILPALHLAVAFACWLLIAGCWGWIAWRRLAWLLPGFLLLLAGGAAISPDFAAMVTYYRDSGVGGIAVGFHRPLLVALALAGGVALLVSWLVLRGWRRSLVQDARSRALAVLLAATTAAAGLFVAQYATLRLGFGEGVYSTYKHLFLLATLALLLTAALPAALSATARQPRPASGNWPALRLPASLLLATTLTLLLPAQLRDLRPAAAAFQAAHGFRIQVLPPEALGTTLVADSELTPILAYGVALAEFALPRDIAARWLYSGQPVPPGPAARFAMVPSELAAGRPGDCVLPGGVSPTYTLVRYDCYALAAQYPRLDQRLGFGRNEPGLRLLGPGWGIARQEGTWNEAPEAQLRLLPPLGVDPDQPLRLTFELLPFLPDQSVLQRVDLRVDGRLLATWQFDAMAPSEVEALLPAGAFAASTALTLTFVMGAPGSPAEGGRRDDPRQLGIMLRGLTVSRP